MVRKVLDFILPSNTSSHASSKVSKSSSAAASFKRNGVSSDMVAGVVTKSPRYFWKFSANHINFSRPLNPLTKKVPGTED